ncbi:MAG TPA: hypothetical protein VF553_22105 [Pyrinomonadaceae bacterium]|jgi:hypothetical protein
MVTRKSSKPAKKAAKKATRKSRWTNVSQHIKELREETWTQYFTEMTAAESLKFLADPKTHLLREGLIKEDYRIQTTVVNTDVPSSVAGPTCKALFVFPDEKLALIIVYRHPSKGK